MKLTIFAVPKPFVGHIGIVQQNAIQSWITLKPRPDVILLGDEPGTRQTAQEYHLRHLPEIELSEHNTPLLSSVFAQGQEAAKTALVAYVNADIILMSDFMVAVNKLPHKRFMMSGQRWNLDVRNAINFGSQGWEADISTQVMDRGALEGPQGMDYFVFPCGTYQQVPPFAIGRTAWDNWLLYAALRLAIPIIDATPSVLAIHQNHDYSHHPQGKYGVWTGIEAQRNIELLGGLEYGQFTLDCADFVVEQRGLVRPRRSASQIDCYLNLLGKARPRTMAWRSLMSIALRCDNFWSEFRHI
ncbi:MAG: hypothetical protein HY711_11020 [Candidatus Melainabacteria bacterium]|nr:hypothetical protein [Candidatus Melainabacteria bacterium]